jgi:hypothetical protein
MKNNLNTFLYVAFIGLCVILLLGLPLQLLWNWLMPSLFNLPHITFWQAVGLNLISSILFKSNTNTKKD